MFRHIKVQPKTLINPSSPSFLSLSSFSSSSSTNDPPPPDQTSSVESSSSSSSSYSSYFSEIKERLKSPQPPPRRIPTNPPPPSFPSSASSPPAASLEEIRKHLAEFRLKSSSESPSGFQDLLKKDIFGKPSSRSEGVPFDSIRESLKKFRSSSPSSSFNIKAFQDGVRQPQLIGTDNLPDSIFGKEMREKKGGGEEGEVKGMKTEFLKMYGYEELGEKLRALRPAKDGDKDEVFSLTELNERLGKLRELEEKETESKMGGVSFRDLRESLQRLKDSDAAKKANSEWFLLLLLCVGI